MQLVDLGLPRQRISGIQPFKPYKGFFHIFIKEGKEVFSMNYRWEPVWYIGVVPIAVAD